MEAWLPYLFATISLCHGFVSVTVVTKKKVSGNNLTRKKDGTVSCGCRLKKIKDSRPVKECPTCGIDFSVKPSHFYKSTYCSRKCMSVGYKSKLKGSANPNYKNSAQKSCEACGLNFNHYSKSRRFCSLDCRDFNARSVMMSTYGVSLDKNHAEIVLAFKDMGCHVIDLASQGGGIPDLIVSIGGRLELVEVKNPKTAYGRRGLNKNQKRWADEWGGGNVFIIRTKDDVANMVNGNYKGLDIYITKGGSL